ncbi:MAG: hypothetical protein GX442_05800 [Candidatus Riflebacteria bacterium]|nr:hypothetical protein [Candidatus Riflebacteria bacterium]
MTNPFDFGRTMLQAWEKTTAETLEKLTHDEAFLKQMSQALGSSLDVKKQMETHAEKYLQSINMPTRSDLDRILTYLQRIEARLLDLEDRLDAAAAPAPTPEAATSPAPAPTAATHPQPAKAAPRPMPAKGTPSPKKATARSRARK